MERKFYQLRTEQVSDELKTDLERGLVGAESKNRLASYGPNQLVGKKGRGPLAIFLDQFRDFIVWVLIGAALISGFLGEWIDSAAIIAIVLLNSILGFIQEYRAERSLAALKKLSSPTSKVIRDGQLAVVPSADLVPGDLIEIEAGDNIPADCRLTYVTANFATSEASLTGESVPVSKTVMALDEKEVPLAERANMVYMGTSVAAGKARALVVGTGMKTELGRIAGMIQEIEEIETPLQKRLEQFGRWIVYACILLVALIFVMQLNRGESLLNVFITAVSLAVAAIPEGLPAVVTIALALGVQRMVKRNALIRKLPSVETLGSATVICSDKTGTLTKNEMTVQSVYSQGEIFSISGVGYATEGKISLGERDIEATEYQTLYKTLMTGVLCNGARLYGGKIYGDPTEGAILIAAAKAGLAKDQLEADHAFVEEIPFDSERKKMTIIRRAGDKYIAYVKGAPDILLDDCTQVEEGAKKEVLSDSRRSDILAVNSKLAGDAMRVLAVAYKEMSELPEKLEAGMIEKDLVFLGLIGMIDPPREEVKAAVQECGTAGIRTVMITGDHKNTAVAVAREIGFFKENSLALSGEEIDRLNESELYDMVEEVSVYARVSPEHKLKIVRALRQHGEVVAMTGDGVNDAPAVKEADIGVAMGITGTDVTKEVSDMVITDDNFASIVSAVKEGRGIYDNIRKFVHYLLSCNVGEIMVMFVASLIGWPIPLLPIHILWVNLVTDGFPALALGVDPVDPGIMQKRPRPVKEPVVTLKRGGLMLGQGAFIALCSLLAFWFVLYFEQSSVEKARTAAFIVLACSQIFHSFNCRNLKQSLFKIGPFSNQNLLIAAAVSFILQIGVVYLPFFQAIFKTQALGLIEWGMVVVLSSIPLWAMEITKLVNKKAQFLPEN